MTSFILLFSAIIASTRGAVIAGPGQYHSQNELHEYTYGYYGGPSAKHETKIHNITKGEYSYIDPNGKIQLVKYISDNNGFHVEASNLPTIGHAIPAVLPISTPTTSPSTPTTTVLPSSTPVVVSQPIKNIEYSYFYPTYFPITPIYQPILPISHIPQHFPNVESHKRLRRGIIPSYAPVKALKHSSIALDSTFVPISYGAVPKTYGPHGYSFKPEHISVDKTYAPIYAPVKSYVESVYVPIENEVIHENHTPEKLYNSYEPSKTYGETYTVYRPSIPIAETNHEANIEHSTAPKLFIPILSKSVTAVPSPSPSPTTPTPIRYVSTPSPTPYIPHVSPTPYSNPHEVYIKPKSYPHPQEHSHPHYESHSEYVKATPQPIHASPFPHTIVHEPKIVHVTPAPIHVTPAPIHVTPSPYTPIHASPSHAPTYASPSPHTPIHTSPTPHTPVYASPSPFAPIHASPTPHAPVYASPSPHAPVYASPSPHVPIHTSPTPHTPIYASPSPHSPIYASPSPHSPTYVSPSSPRPHVTSSPNIPSHESPSQQVPLFVSHEPIHVTPISIHKSTPVHVTPVVAPVKPIPSHPVPAHPVSTSKVIIPVVPLAIKSQYHSQDELKQYTYGYSNEHSIKHEIKTADGITKGEYSYIDANGHVQNVKYISDDHNGFRVAATNLPKGPVPLAEPVHLSPVPQPIHVKPAPVHLTPEPIHIKNEPIHITPIPVHVTPVPIRVSPLSLHVSTEHIHREYA